MLYNQSIKKYYLENDDKKNIVISYYKWEKSAFTSSLRKISLTPTECVAEKIATLYWKIILLYKYCRILYACWAKLEDLRRLLN